MALRVIEYRRVSRDHQEDGMGLDEQSQRNRDWLEKNDAVSVGEFTDVGVSGATPIDERPQFMAALAALRDLKADGILVAHRDRFARSMVVAVSAEQVIKTMGGRMFSASGAGNGEQPEDQLLVHIEWAFAAYARALTRVRTMVGKQLSGKKSGHLWAKAPYGYAPSAVPGVPVIDPVEGWWVQRIFEKNDEGRGMGNLKLSKWLKQQGAPRRAGGSDWHPIEVLRILQHREFYAGKVLQTGEPSPHAAQPPLIGPRALALPAPEETPTP